MRSVFEPLPVEITKDEIMADVREMKTELKAKDARVAELEDALSRRDALLWDIRKSVLFPFNRPDLLDSIDAALKQKD